MLSVTRKQKIKELILEKKSATVAELSKMFNVTDETIRRDLSSLEKEGVLLRSYGGAFIQTGVDNQINSNIRSTVYVEGKTAIAKKCKQFLHNGDVIFLDNSTTAYFLAKEFCQMRLTVVTNSLSITNFLSGFDNIRLIVTGGFYSSKEKAFYGTSTLEAIEKYYVDKAFFSCRSLSVENGITDSYDQWAQVRKTIIERSEKRYLIADFSKFNQTSFMRVCGFEKITAIITDKPLSADWHAAMQKYGCVIYDKDEGQSEAEPPQT